MNTEKIQAEPPKAARAGAGFPVAELVVVSLAAAFACVWLGLSYGQDINWDLKNYHMYAAYALFNGRLDVDVAPAQLQTWFNPLLSIVPYFSINYLPPRIAAGVFALASVPSLVLIYAIGSLSLKADLRRSAYLRIFIALLATVGAFSAPMFVSELATTFADVTCCAFVLGALVAVMATGFSTRGYVLAGVLLGIAVGLKLTNIFYVVGWAVALILVEGRHFWRPALCSGAAAVAAYIPVGGIWNAFIALKTGNPLFPAYNHLFQSPLYPPRPMLDSRFRPTDLRDAVRYLGEWPAGLHPSAEMPFSDFRLTLLVVFFIIVAAAGCLWRKRPETGVGVATADIFGKREQTFLLTFFMVSFVVWLGLFGIQRYAVGLEQLAPLIIIILLAMVARDRASLIIGSSVLVSCIVVFTQPASWGRAPFTRDWFDIKVPEPLQGGGTAFVMLTSEPMAYVIPFLPASDIFLRIEGNMPISPDTGLGALITERLAAHGGSLRTLAPSGYSLATSAGSLAAYGLSVDRGDCLMIPTKVGGLETCRLVRANP